tara:strand:+ start:219 stop:1268 length:1050 start_codon:yes stop_codon:yes gene_type:complete
MLHLSGLKNAKFDVKWGRNWIRMKDDKLFVKLEFIAVPYLKFYWDMFFNYRLKQSATKNQYYTCTDCNNRQPITGFIKNISKCSRCKSFNLKHKDLVLVEKIFIDSKGIPIIPPKKIEEVANNLELLKQFIFGMKTQSVTTKSGFAEVLFALNENGFYKKIPNFKSRNKIPKTVLENGLEFDIKIIDVLTKFRIPIENALNYKLTHYLESINNSPRISEKILLNPKRPELKSQEKKQMWEHNPPGLDSCFYCGKSEKSFAIDHVVPFDYVLDTKLFNSVPACNNCNCTKSNKLPDRESHFQDVLERNRKMDLDFYDEKMFEKLYDDCLIEYNGDRDFFIRKKYSELSEM